MKKITFIFAALAFFAILISCNKEPKMIIRNGHIIEDDSDNNNNDGYTWYSCQPKPINFDKSEFVSGSGNDAIYWYYFNVSLDNSQANANSITSALIFFPHIGPGGTTIYENVNNDATYEVINIKNGYVYFKIKTANVINTGCPLKFNLALTPTPSNYIWFSANGSYTQNVGIDDGSHNCYFITFLNGNITKAF